MGHINHEPEYVEIASRKLDTRSGLIVERSGNVLRICAGSTPRFNRSQEAEYRRYKEADP